MGQEIAQTNSQDREKNTETQDNHKAHFLFIQHNSHLWQVSRLMTLAALVGIIAGLGAIAFHYLCHLVSYYTLSSIAGYSETSPAGERVMGTFFKEATTTNFVPWLLVIIPAIGGLISGLIIYTFAPEAEGHGTDAAIQAYHKNRGIIRARVPILKMIASAITIGTGGSGGREGPIAQIGAGFGSFLATKLKLSDNDRRVLLAAGLGAGIGAIFRAPLAGAIFAAEVLYSEPDFEAEALIPSFISTTIAYCIFSLVFGFEPLFAVEPAQFNNPLLLIPFAVLAGIMTIASLIYVKCFYGLHTLFKRIPIPNHIKPAIGGLATGLVAILGYHIIGMYNPDFSHDVLSVLAFGYGFLQKLLIGEIPTQVSSAIVLLLAVGLGKILTTSLTIGSGGSGGVFGPSMVIGGALGAVVGLLFHIWMPNIVTRIDVFVILGMASFFAAAANTPVSTLIMVTEMTASYTLLLPAMWVCAIAYILSRGWTIYKEQLPSRIESPAHRGDFIVNILEGLTVKDALRPGRTVKTVSANTLLKDMSSIITDSTQSCFPVTDEKEKYHGIFTLNDIRQFLYDNEFATLASAEDLASTNIEPLYLDTDLGTALKRFASSKFEELPIVDRQTGKVIGMLRRQDVLATYDAKLVEARGKET